MCVHPSICLSASIILQVGLHVQSSPNFCACYLCNIAVARSVLLWRSCDTLRTSGLWMTSYLLIMTRNIDVDVKRHTYYTHTRSSKDLTPRGVCSNWPTRGQHRIWRLNEASDSSGDRRAVGDRLGPGPKRNKAHRYCLVWIVKLVTLNSYGNFWVILLP